ncbi:MAG: insulinase family protein [Phycisphaerales bacterium]|nr:insulinase family protein [Phycisphaerae bacterium]NNF43704.1 insulinase family protein [Phycisphaerales bacterium]NNM25458.1 insulinase family protein [Phycisphaerales bacterium]
MRTLLPTLLAVTLLSAGVAAQSVEVEEVVLDNGMTFLLMPRHEQPNTISCGWVAKVGSVNERPGITGISHFFEHMMFKGTTSIGTSDVAADAKFMERQRAVKKQINELIWGEQYERYRRGEIDDPWDPAHDTQQLSRLRTELRRLMDEHRSVIEKNEFAEIYTNAGATGLNAFTSNDITFYIITLPSNKLELWTWMESDRLSDSVFREFYAERDVVHEERRMRLESSPTGELDEQFDAMFWQSSPYSWSVIGWPSDLNSYTREQFDEYFNIYYRPNNLVGVIVGDFEIAEVMPLIETYFGRLQPGVRPPAPVVTLEVEQLAEKRLIGSCDCQPQIKVRYHTVPFGHADGDTLDVLSAVLNGRTGRLYKSMVEGMEIAAGAMTRQESMKYAGSFLFQAEVKGEATPSDLEAAWESEVARLKEEPVSPYELQKVKNQIAADAYRRLETNNALMIQLGMYEAMGEWEYINESPVRLAAVTAEDIMRVANTYFTPKNRCVALYSRRPRPTGDDGGDDELAQFPPEVRQQIEAMMSQLMTKDNPDELRMIVGMMEAQAGSVPPEHQATMAYVVKKLNERIAQLDGGDQ